MLEMMGPCAGQRSFHHDAVWRTDHEPTGLEEQPLTGCLGQLSPQFVRALDQWNVERMFEIGFPDDTRLAVRRSKRVRWMQSVEPENFAALPRKLKRGRTAHCAQPRNDHVVGFRHGYHRFQQSGQLKMKKRARTIPRRTLTTQTDRRYQTA